MTTDASWVWVFDRAAVPAEAAKRLDFDAVDAVLADIGQVDHTELRQALNQLLVPSRLLSEAMVKVGGWLAPLGGAAIGLIIGLSIDNPLPGALAVIAGTVAGLIVAMVWSTAGANYERTGDPALLRRGTPRPTDLDVIASALTRVDLAQVDREPSPEMALAQRACEITAAIAGSRAWSDPYLDDHRVRLNLTEERNQVLLRCQKITDARRTLGAPTNDPHIQALHHQSIDQLDNVVAGLRIRVDALEQYHDHIRQLSIQLDGLEQLGQLEETTDTIAQLLIDTARDDVAASHMTGLSREVRAMAEAVADTIALLTNDVHQLEERADQHDKPMSSSLIPRRRPSRRRGPLPDT